MNVPQELYTQDKIQKEVLPWQEVHGAVQGVCTVIISVLHIRLVYIRITVLHLPQTQKLVNTCYVRIDCKILHTLYGKIEI